MKRLLIPSIFTFLRINLILNHHLNIEVTSFMEYMHKDFVIHHTENKLVNNGAKAKVYEI